MTTDPFADSDPAGGPSQLPVPGPAPAPARRAMFKNRNRTVVPRTEEAAQAAISFFSRSREIFPESLAIEKRERERRESAKEEEETRASRARSGSGDEGESARKKNKSESRSATPPPRRSRSRSKDERDEYTPSPSSPPPPPIRRSPRSQRKQSAIISLSDSEDEPLPPNPSAKPPYRALTAKPITFDYSSPQKQPQSPTAEPIAIPSSPEEEELYPELIAAARRAAAAETAQLLIDARKSTKRTASLQTISSASTADSSHLSPSTTLPTNPSPPPDSIVTILVTSRISGTAPLAVRRKLSQRLKDVRMAWCDKQLIDGQQPLDAAVKAGIFLTWKGRRVWDVTTCGSMGVRVDARGRIVGAGVEDTDGGVVAGADGKGNVHLEAWTEEVWEEAEDERRRSDRARMARAAAADLSDEDGEEEALEVLPAEPVVQKIRIVLQARGMEAFKLIVKPTTTIRTMVAGFRQTRGIGPETGVELWFDGERLEEESCVADADLEDMTTIDVIVR